jgi:hypothetical protein
MSISQKFAPYNHPAQMEPLLPSEQKLGALLEQAGDAACLAFEENGGQHGVRAEALRGLHYLFATQGELERADFKAMLGLGDRLATAQVSALLARGLLQSDTPYGKLRFGVPQHALRFYFPRLWSEAEVDS